MKAVRALKRTAGVVALALAAYVAATLLTARQGDRDLYPAKPGEPAAVIYVMTNPLHSNLVIPSSLLTRTPGPTATAIGQLAPGPWVQVGWGDDAFYQGLGWGPARLLDLPRVFFAPGNPSVVRLATTTTPTVDPTHPEGFSVTLSQRGLDRLRARLDAALALENGQPVEAGRTGPDAAFFRGVEHFSILRVCNHWTADLLSAAGVPVTPMLVASSFGLKLDLTRRGGAAPLE
jgi:hypothetical protein